MAADRDAVPGHTSGLNVFACHWQYRHRHTSGLDDFNVNDRTDRDIFCSTVTDVIFVSCFTSLMMQCCLVYQFLFDFQLVRRRETWNVIYLQDDEDRRQIDGHLIKMYVSCECRCFTRYLKKKGLSNRKILYMSSRIRTPNL